MNSFKQEDIFLVFSWCGNSCHCF